MAEPATTIITHCGGVATVADWLKLNRTSVLRWMHPKARGGTGGLIPSKHQATLIAEAKRHGKPLKPADFFASERQVQVEGGSQRDAAA